MNIQVYIYKRHFDVQRAERFFKERRIPFQTVDLRKHRLGMRELELFARAAGAMALVDAQQEAVKSHPIAYTDDAGRILGYLLERPDFLKTPLIRDGQRTLIGFDEARLLSWLKTP